MRDNWYHHWVAGATLDDQLWHQALVMDRVLELLRGSEQGPNDAMMWTLLRRGVVIGADPLVGLVVIKRLEDRPIGRLPLV